jgi:nucleotidyltransferase substrate binding protein (TIGR01987 family)
LSNLETEGVARRFGYTWKLAWKLLADLLESEGVTLEPKTPRNVLREAIAAKLIEDGDTWMDALDARNQMSHTYDIEEFEKVVREIQERFYDLFVALDVSIAQRAARLA